MFVEEGVPEGYYEIELGEPSVKRNGQGPDDHHARAGALYRHGGGGGAARQRFGLSAEVIDLRSVNPLNYEPLVESVRKTGKVLLVCDAVERGCVMQTVAATLTQLCFDDLDAPPVVIGSRNWITPAAELETLFFPQPGWLLDAIHERILPLKGYRPQYQPDARRDGPAREARHLTWPGDPPRGANSWRPSPMPAGQCGAGRPEVRCRTLNTGAALLFDWK